MRIRSLAALLAAASLAIPLCARAQSLAEIAEKEKQRRAAAKAKGRTYTEADLGRSGRGTMSVSEGEPPPSPPPAEAKPAGEAGAPPQKSEDEKRAELEKAWRERLQKANQEVTRLTAEVDRLQAALNDVTQGFYAATRTERLNQLDQAQKRLAAAKQTVGDLEEEGRRSRFR